MQRINYHKEIAVNSLSSHPHHLFAIIMLSSIESIGNIGRIYQNAQKLHPCMSMSV